MQHAKRSKHKNRTCFILKALLILSCLVRDTTTSFINTYYSSSFQKKLKPNQLVQQQPQGKKINLSISINNDSTRRRRRRRRIRKSSKLYNNINSKQEDTNNSNNKQFLERNKRLIVLIDDEESIRLAVGDFLYDAGYQVTACSDADAFLDLFTINNNNNNNSKDNSNNDNKIIPPPTIPDVIVSDIRMPNSSKDGIELTMIIRQNQRLKRIPIILLTAKTLTNDRIIGYKAGANIYLPKPFDPNELLAIIDNLIYRKNQIVDSISSTNNGSKILDLQTDMSDIKYLLQQQNYNIDSSTSSSSSIIKANTMDNIMQGANPTNTEGIYLTPVELEVLELLSNGYTNGEIANKRNVGIAWVNRIIQNLYMKTNTKTRTELVRWAMKNDQISTR